MRMGIGESALLLNLPLSHVAGDIKVVRELFERARGGAEKGAVIDVILVARIRRLRLGSADKAPDFAIVLRIALSELQRMRAFELRQRPAEDVGNPAVSGNNRPDFPDAGDLAILRAVDAAHV